MALSHMALNIFAMFFQTFREIFEKNLRTLSIEVGGTLLMEVGSYATSGAAAAAAKGGKLLIEVGSYATSGAAASAASRRRPQPRISDLQASD